MLSCVNQAEGMIIGIHTNMEEAKKDIRKKYYQRKFAFSSPCFVKGKIYQV